MLRSVAAIAAGILVTAVLFQLGAVVVLLSTVGIPLGAEARASTPGELLAYLGVGVMAAVAGGHVLVKMAGGIPFWPLLTLAVILAVSVLMGFGPSWPRWWVYALTFLAPVGAWAGGRRAARGLHRRGGAGDRLPPNP